MVIWTDQAKKRIVEIHDYIAQDNPAVAKKFVQEIIDFGETLDRFQKMGKVTRHGFPDNIREIVYRKKYTIIYLIVDEMNIEIITIRHNRQA